MASVPRILIMMGWKILWIRTEMKERQKKTTGKRRFPERKIYLKTSKKT